MIKPKSPIIICEINVCEVSSCRVRKEEPSFRDSQGPPAIAVRLTKGYAVTQQPTHLLPHRHHSMYLLIGSVGMLLECTPLLQQQSVCLLLLWQCTSLCCDGACTSHVMSVRK